MNQSSDSIILTDVPIANVLLLPLPSTLLYRWRSWRRWVLLVFWCFFLFARSEFILTHRVERCTAGHTNLTERQVSLELFCSVVGRIFTCLDMNSFDLAHVFVHVPGLLASKFHVRFKKLGTSPELLIPQSEQPSTSCPLCCVNSNMWPFFSRS